VPSQEKPPLNYDDVIVLDEKNRMFAVWSTAEIKDKQGDLIPFEAVMKIIPIILKRRAPITIAHTNKIVGEVIGMLPGTHPKYKVPAVRTMGRIFDDYRADDAAWEGLKSGKYKESSMGGQQAGRDANGEVEWVETCEIAIVEAGANPGADDMVLSMAKAGGEVGKEYDMEQVKMGIGVEMEHTKDPRTALKIALDHLDESSDYYTKLKEVESEQKSRSAKEDGNMAEEEPKTPVVPPENPEDAKKQEPGTQEPVTPVAEPEEDKYVQLEKRMAKMEESIPEIVKEAIAEALKAPETPEEAYMALGKEDEPAPAAKPAEAKPEEPKKPAAVEELNKSLETSKTPRPDAAEKKDKGFAMEKAQRKAGRSENPAADIARGKTTLSTLDLVKGKVK